MTTAAGARVTAVHVRDVSAFMLARDGVSTARDLVVVEDDGCGGGRRDPFPAGGDGREAPGWSPAAPEQRTRAAWSSRPPPHPRRPRPPPASSAFLTRLGSTA